jgi:hypothetical protein
MHSPRPALVKQRLANPLDDVVEPEIGREYGILVSEDDFSAPGTIKYKPPSVAGKETDLKEVLCDLSEFKNVTIRASEERDFVPKRQLMPARK